MMNMMSRFIKIFTALLFIVIQQTVYSQHHPDKYVDSLFILSEYYGTNNIDSCKIIGEHLFSYSKKNNDKDGLALAYFCLSRHEDRKGDYAAAASLASKGLDLYNDKVDTRNVKYVLKLTNQLGINYRLIGQSNISRKLLTGELELIKKYNLKGYDVDLLYAHLANLYLDFKKFDTVRIYCMKVIDTIPNRFNTNMLAARNNALGRTAVALGKIDESLNINLNTIQFCEKYNNKFFKTSALQLIASLYLQQNILDSAFFYAKKSLELANKHHFYRHIHSNAQILVSCFEKTNQLDSLYKYLQIELKTNEFLYGKDKVAQLVTMNNESQLKAKDSILKLETESFRNRILLLVFILSLLSLGLVFLNYKSRQKNKINKILEDQNIKIENKNKELENALVSLKSTQAQLIQSEKMASLGELTAGIAHEIQNPLNFVNNFSEVSNELLEEVLDERSKETGARNEGLENEILADIKENLIKISHHGKRASDIVKGMLEHSRTSTGKKELTDINALCDEYLRLSYHGLRAKDKSFNATMETHFDPNLPKIEIIPQDIGRVILNLINNAFYAVNERSKKGEVDFVPTVSVNTELTANSQLLIAVKDNGLGIPAHIKDKIFQPFFTTKPTGQGTGLGLSLSYDIVKAHGGQLKVYSKEGEDVPVSEAGSEFVIFLPM